MEWRSVKVSGEYDFENQIALRNQYNGDQYGYHLLTPLLFGPSMGSGQTKKVVFVDRGWIPAEGNSTSSDWRKYDELGSVIVSGQIRLGQSKPAFGGVADTLPANGAKLEVWNNADLTHIANQMPHPVLPVYIQPATDPSDTEPPIPFQPEVEITEGPHMGYALQWFTFAAILFVGYPFFLRKQEKELKMKYSLKSSFARLVLVLFFAVLVLTIVGRSVAVTGAIAYCNGFPFCDPSHPLGWLKQLHIVLVGVASVLMFFVLSKAWREQRHQNVLLPLATILGVMFFGQAVVGAMQVLQSYPPHLVFLHTLTTVALWVSLLLLVYTSGILAVDQRQVPT